MIDQKTKVDAAEAIFNNDISTFKAMLDAEPGLFTEPPTSGNWLHVAAIKDTSDVVEWLLSKGLSPNATESISPFSTPLFTALTNENLKVARIFLEHGADPNVDRLVLTPLCGTVKHRSLEAIKLLEEFGVDLHAVFQDEIADRPINALSTAIGNGKDDVVEYLKSRGCKMPE